MLKTLSRIKHRPTEAELGSALAEVLKIDGFYDVALRAQPQRFLNVIVSLRNGKDDYGNFTGKFVGLDAPKYFEPMNLGQMQIQQHHLRSVCLWPFGIVATAEDIIQGFDSIVYNVNRIGELGLSKGCERELNVFLIIFDQENIAQLGRACLTIDRFSIFDRCENSAERGAQGKSKPLNTGERGVAFARFDVAHVRAMQIGALGEFFLRNPKLNSSPFYFCPKALLDVSRLHEEIRDMKHPHSYLQTISYK